MIRILIIIPTTSISGEIGIDIEIVVVISLDSIVALRVTWVLHHVRVDLVILLVVHFIVIVIVIVIVILWYCYPTHLFIEKNYCTANDNN